MTTQDSSTKSGSIPPSSLSHDFYAAVARYSAKYRDTSVVIKFGGELVSDDQALRAIATQAINLKSLGANVVLVHGGGKQIDDQIAQAGLTTRKVDGVRDTTPEVMDITKGCLAALNEKITSFIDEEARALGSNVRAWGMGGHDGGVISAEPMFEGTLTGRINHVKSEKLEMIMLDSTIPVIYPICAGKVKPRLNVNADDVASAVAIALNAERLVLCSDTCVLDQNKKRIAQIGISEVKGLIEDGTLQGGMTNKVKSAADVVESGRVKGVVILNGKDPLSIANELLSDEGAGTLILKKTEQPKPAASTAFEQKAKAARAYTPA